MHADSEQRPAFFLSQGATAGIACGAVLLAAAAAAVSLANEAADGRVFHAVANAATILILIAVGLFAWGRVPDNRFGPLLVAAGVGWFLVSLSTSDSSGLYSIGRASVWVEEVLLIYLFLCFPFGRLPTGASRSVALLAVGTVVLLYLPTALFVQQFPNPSPYSLCVDDCPPNAFMLTATEPGFVDSLVRPLRDLLTAVIYLGTAVILAVRVKRASASMRRTLTPVLVAATFGAAAAFLYVGARRTGGFDDATFEVVGAIRSLTTPVAAVGFLTGLASWKLHEARVLERLALASPSSTSREELQKLLAWALGDPTLEILYCSDESGGGWQDVRGRPAPAPEESVDRCLVKVGGEADGFAAILCDPALKDQRPLVEAAGSWIETSLERGRLTALLDISLRDVEASRRRLATVAAGERRRIERDLHDGAQQRLVTLRVQLALAAEELKRDPAGGTQRLQELGLSIDAVIDEVRSLARGIYPPLLADAGLGEALRAAAVASAIDVDVDVDGIARYPLEIESAVYFCCLEALQNVAKHSHASVASVAVGTAAGRLRFEVRDEGDGFSPDHGAGGTGLTNMRDRVAAVGGELVVDSSPGGGTRVSGEVPARALT